MSEAEFDKYSADYGAGMDNLAKRIAGSSATDFLRPKVEILGELLRGFPKDASMLDFGCGTADFLRLVCAEWPQMRLEGCDLSEGMLHEARRRSASPSDPLELWKYDGGDLPAGEYDIVTAVCVFHHIPPAQWVTTATRIRNSLKKGGLFALFEHNPHNPVTSWIVSRTPIDANAVLLSPGTAAKVCRKAGLHPRSLRNFMFFPPRLRFLRPIERALARVPFGGQYVLTATPDPSATG